MAGDALKLVESRAKAAPPRLFTYGTTSPVSPALVVRMTNIDASADVEFNRRGNNFYHLALEGKHPDCEYLFLREKTRKPPVLVAVKYDLGKWQAGAILCDSPIIADIVEESLKSHEMAIRLACEARLADWRYPYSPKSDEVASLAGKEVRVRDYPAPLRMDFTLDVVNGAVVTEKDEPLFGVEIVPSNCVRLVASGSFKRNRNNRRKMGGIRKRRWEKRIRNRFCGKPARVHAGVGLCRVTTDVRRTRGQGK